MVDLALASDASHAKRVFNMRVPRSRDQWPRVIWKSPTTMELWAPNRAEIHGGSRAGVRRRACEARVQHARASFARPVAAGDLEEPDDDGAVGAESRERG